MAHNTAQIVTELYRLSTVHAKSTPPTPLLSTWGRPSMRVGELARRRQNAPRTQLIGSIDGCETAASWHGRCSS